jgi:hypothetical protein
LVDDLGELGGGSLVELDELVLGELSPSISRSASRLSGYQENDGRCSTKKAKGDIN